MITRRVILPMSLDASTRAMTKQTTRGQRRHKQTHAKNRVAANTTTKENKNSGKRENKLDVHRKTTPYALPETASSMPPDPEQSDAGYLCAWNDG